MKLSLKFTIALATVLALALPLQAQEKLKVGFIYKGSVGDHGWIYQHDVARKAIEAAFPGRVETTFVENVSEVDAERPIEQLARTGHKLIFTTTYGYMDRTLRVAQKYPDVKFEHATGYKRADNVSTYSARFHEGRYIVGRTAAKMSKTGTIGYLAAFPIPEVVAGINAYTLGAQSINPNIKIRIVWVNSWYDPGKEADAAKALFDLGVDVITQHTDSPAPLQQAEARGKYAFGQASDMEHFAPKALLTSITTNWTPYFLQRVQAVLDGTWKSTDTWDGIDKNVVKMAAYKNMPEDVKAMAMATEEALRSRRLDPFKCPVYDQTGKEVECKGNGALSPAQVHSMHFYVKGIDDKFPK